MQNPTTPEKIPSFSRRIGLQFVMAMAFFLIPVALITAVRCCMPAHRFQKEPEKVRDALRTLCLEYCEKVNLTTNAFMEFSPDEVAYPPELRRYRPEKMIASTNSVFIHFYGRIGFSVTWEGHPGVTTSDQLTIFDGTFTSVSIRKGSY